VQVEEALSPSLPAPPARGTYRIQPSRGLIPVDLRELWRFRELLYRFLWRDIKARYKQTVLGPSWAIIRPLVAMILMAAIFGGLAGFKSGTSVPYPLFLYAGLLIWQYFASALSGATTSVLNNAALLGKAYFPRLFAPLAAVIAPLVDFVLGFTVMFGLFAYYRWTPGWHIVLLPCFLLLAVFAGLGVGLWLAGIAVRYRDVPFALPFVIQLWFYVTPVLYPVSRLPDWAHIFLALNPMTAVVDGFRWSLLGMAPPDVPVLLGSTAFSVFLVGVGLFLFRRTERTIVDVL
jgi:lipopolysaccharide transport system permease protein